MVWTDASRQSHRVREEATEALDQDKLIPLRFEPVKPPFGFRTIHAEDFVGWDGDKTAECWRRLALQLSGLTGVPIDRPTTERAAPQAEPSAPAPAPHAVNYVPLLVTLASVGGLIAAFLNDWGVFSSGVFGASVGLALAFLSLFQIADSHLPPHLKALAGRWLVPVKGGVRVSVAEAFNQLFEAVFYRRHLSFRCLWRSAFASTLALGLIFAFGWFFLADFRRVFDGAWSPLLRNALIMTAIANIVGDYVSLGQTRLFLRWAARAPIWLPVLVVADAVFTLGIYLGVTFGAFLALEPLFAELLGSARYVAVDDAGQVTLKQLGPVAYFQSLFPASPDSARWLPVQWVFVFSILTAFITSVWLWLVLLFGPLARLLLARDGEVSGLGRGLGMQTHPFTGLGMMVALLMVVIGGAVGFFLRDASEGEWEIVEAGHHCAECPEMVILPKGSITMGSSEDEGGRFTDEGPQREVIFDYRLAVGRYEVSWAEWEVCVDEGGCQARDDSNWGRGARPVINVSWHDAQDYVAWLNTKVADAPYRLLTEAEWEYAARAGTQTRYAFSDGISSDQANFAEEPEFGRTAPTGSYPANAFGLYDMHGNVWEWVEACYHDSYSGTPTDGSVVTSGDCPRRVLRGGPWDYNPWLLRSGRRVWGIPTTRNNIIGFRVARTVSPE